MTQQQEILGDPNYIPLLNHGFIGLVDVMGDDLAVAQAARVSYGAGTRSVREDRGLIRYLFRHFHCYHPAMQVLTIEGWKRWDQCGLTETFLVPDPKNRSYRTETLEVRSFDVNEQTMHVFGNARMSYSVTSDHKMWFKGKYQKSFSTIPVQDMSRWGWFDPLTGYTHDLDKTSGEGDDEFRFIGFFLGDGSGVSPNRLNFHLKKDRKIAYLTDLMDRLRLEYTTRESTTHGPDGISILITTPSFLREWVDPNVRSQAKCLLKSISSLNAHQALGLFDGLVNSDGHICVDRDRITFASNSDDLIELFCALAARVGYDAHLTYKADNDTNCQIVNAYPDGGTTLESRKQYHSTESFTGKVYCTTTSTGLLAVRGGPSTYGFVCGNSSPIEMAEVKLHLKLPIIAMRQLIRHRTANVNEYSGRYSIMSDEFYLPDPEVILPQSTDNKQGRAGEMSDKNKLGVQWMMNAIYETAYDCYQALLGEKDKTKFIQGDVPYGAYDEDDAVFDQDFTGIARELARTVLPVANYTECYWKIDLSNLMKLLRLRTDAHAQYEIRVYADAMYKLIEPIFPLCCEAFVDYQKDAVTLSRMEVSLVKDIMAGQSLGTLIEAAGGVKALADHYGMSKRELDEFRMNFGG